MVEKKLVVDTLRLSYNGAFDIIEFFKEVEDWISENGYEKELKMKSEHVLKDSKKVEWHIECWKAPNDWGRQVISMRALISNLKDIEVKKGKSRRRINCGDVMIIFDAWFKTDLEARWHQKPGYYFPKILFDKYIYRFWGEKEKWTEPLRKDTYSLHKRLNAFFNLYKY